MCSPHGSQAWAASSLSSLERHKGGGGEGAQEPQSKQGQASLGLEALRTFITYFPPSPHSTPPPPGNESEGCCGCVMLEGRHPVVWVLGQLVRQWLPPSAPSLPLPPPPPPTPGSFDVSAVWVCSQVPADGGPVGKEDRGTQPLQVLSVPRLQRKLKEAARKILRLRLEKEQLLELGNRLRAELGHLTGGSFPPTPPLLWGWRCRVQGRAGLRRAGWRGEAQPRLGLGTEGEQTGLSLISVVGVP